MTRFKQLLAILVAISPYGMAQTEIYESRDAQGNPVFSDEPPAGAADAEVVKLPETNIAEPVEPAPTAASQPPPSQGQQQGSAEGRQPAVGGDVIVLEDPRQERVEQERERNRRDEVLDAEPRRTVSDAEPRHQTP